MSGSWSGFSLYLCLFVWFIPNSNAVSTGTVRLYRNGVPDTSQSWSSGIVQIYYDYEWGNICDDYYFGSDEADVICHQLGYTGAYTYSNTGYTTVWGTDPSSGVLSQVSCSSSSYLTITQCSFSTPSYGCSNDVTVTCYTTRIWDSPSSGDIRLTGGTYSNQGLLEVYCNGQWGTVCDDYFETTEARIACKQLGYNYYTEYSSGLFEGTSSQSIWLRYLTDSCSSSTDTCLVSCGSCSTLSITGCGHSEDITLECGYSSSYLNVTTLTTSSQTCYNSIPAPTGTVRLYRNGVGDTSQSWSSGIVQIYYNYEWGNICDDSSFGSDEADVICHQLGYTGASSYSNTGSTTIWGSDSSPTVVDGVSCSSSSYLTITQCSFSSSSYYYSSCDDSNDAIVTCYSTRIWNSPSSGDIRLTGGTYSNQGLLEVYCNGEWGTVCRSQFSTAQGTAACKQLGYNDLNGINNFSIRGSSSQSIWMEYFQLSCSSSSTCLTSCGVCSSRSVTSCTHSDDVTLECEYYSSFSKVSTTTSSDCQTSADVVSTGTVRLYSNGVPDTSQSWSSGIVQIYYDGEWGNICDDYYFGSDEADVICHQLGYTGAYTHSNTGYTTTWGTDPSSGVLSQVSCSSSSYLTITQCSFSTPSYGCSNDITVTCYTTRIWDSPSSGDIRLTGGTYSNQGLLEVYCNGQWGTVCDDYFETTEARIACKQLGYNYYTDYNSGLFEGTSSQSIWLRYLTDSCSSSTDTCLVSCGSCSTLSITGCSHSEDITLKCEYSSFYSKVSTTTTSCHSGADIASTGAVRLYRNGVGDTTQSLSSGIVQIYYNDKWGNICDDSSFGSDEADVICHQLGYTGASSYSNTGYTTYTYGTDSSPTVMDEVSCSSSSYLTITQCFFSTSISFSCTDNTDVTVSCYTTRIWDSPLPGDIRLTGGTYSNQGLLEIYCNGQWGTVCDDYFGATEARIACKQLGYNYYTDYDHLNMRGNYSQSIWLQYLSSCSSTSDTCLTSCGSCPSSGVTGCSHSEDITLTCEHSSYNSIVDTDTSSTCDTSTISNSSGTVAPHTVSTSAIIGIAIGSVVFFIICVVGIISILICICVCLGVGIGSVRGRPHTRVVSRHHDTSSESPSNEEAVPFINYAAGNDESHNETLVTDNEQQSTTTSTTTGSTAPQPSGAVPSPAVASGYPPPNQWKPAATVYPPPSGYPTPQYSTQPAYNTAGQPQYHPAAVTVMPPRQNSPPPPYQQYQQPAAGNTSHVVYPPAAF